MKQWTQTGIVYGVGFCLAFIVWIGLFHTPLFEYLGVFFYRGILLLVLTSFLLTIGLDWYRRQHQFGHIGTKDILLCVTLFFSFQMLFFTHIPVTAERSVSVFLLSYLDIHKERHITREELEGQYVDVYLHKNQAIEKRIGEQIRSGTVESTTGGIRITQRGRFLIQIYTFVVKVFGMNKTILLSY